MSSFSTRQLNIKTKTWSRDSYGLYDYETTNLNVQNLNISEPCHLSRVENQITNAPKPKKGPVETSNDNPLPLASVHDSPDGIRIVANRKDGEASEDDFWYIIERGENAKGHMLKPNDVIKLGRVVFKVNQIKVVQEQDESTDPSQKTIMESIKEHMQKAGSIGNGGQNCERRSSTSDVACKVCLHDKEEEDDPLISPCNCIGSVRYVHLKCIQNWIKSKLNMQQNKNIITIFWKSLYCELCKQKLPLNVTHNGEELSLLPIANKITGSYVVLESFSKAKDSTGIHIIDLSSNQNFKMGRGHECDLKIADISVSRVHALLVVSRGNLYLKDNLSKFGTLVLQKEPVMVTDENPETPWIQCGRTIFKFVLKKSWTAFIPFVGSWFNKIPKISKLFTETENNEEEGGNVGNNGADGKRRANTISEGV